MRGITVSFTCSAALPSCLLHSSTASCTSHLSFKFSFPYDVFRITVVPLGSPPAAVHGVGFPPGQFPPPPYRLQGRTHGPFVGPLAGDLAQRYTLSSETGFSTNEGSDSDFVDASTSDEAIPDGHDSESADVSSTDESISPSPSRSRSRRSHRSRTRSRRSHCSRSHRSRGKHSHRTSRHSRGHRHRSPSSSTDSSSSPSRSASHSSHVKRRPHRRSSSGHRSYRSNRHHRHSDSQLPSPNGVPLSRSLRRKIRRGDCIVGGYISGKWGAPYLSFMAQTTSANLFIRILASGLVNLCRGTISSKTSPSLPLF